MLALVVVGCTTEVGVPTVEHVQTIHDVAETYCSATGTTVKRVYWVVPEDATYIDQPSSIPDFVKVLCSNNSFHSFRL